MLTIAVCDDNLQFARRLVEKIRVMCATLLPERIICQVVAEFTTAEAVLAYLKNNDISILFLDIEIPKCNGFELAAQINIAYPDVIIIFVSAYDNFVYDSFSYSPFRFLRKSHLETELPEAFEKVIEKCIYNLDTMDFITTDGQATIRIKDILYIEGVKNYYIVHCKNKDYKCRGTITSIEENTKKYNFFRIHAAYVVNMDNIEKTLNGCTIVMKNGDQLNISQRRYIDFKNSYMKFTRGRFKNDKYNY